MSPPVPLPSDGPRCCVCDRPARYTILLHYFCRACVRLIRDDAAWREAEASAALSSPSPQPETTP